MLTLSVSNIVITVINILVLYLLLKKFLYKPVMDVIETRNEMIASQFANARKTEEDALKLKAEYENSLNSAQKEAQQIVENSRGKAKQEYDRIVQEADKQAEKIIDNAHKTIKMDQEKAVKNIEGEIASLAMVAVSKMLGENQNTAINQELYGQFIAQAGEKHDTNSN